MNETIETYKTRQTIKRRRTILMIMLIIAMSAGLGWFGRGLLGLTQNQYIGMLIATVAYSVIWDELAKWRRDI